MINHPPVITIFIGGFLSIPSHGWFMTLFYHVLPCFTMFYHVLPYIKEHVAIGLPVLWPQ